MKKFDVVASIIMVVILIYRIYLLVTDNSGYYLISRGQISGLILFETLPELAILFSLVGVNLNNNYGLTIKVVAIVVTIFALSGECLTVFANFMNYGNTISSSVKPILNIPILMLIIASLVIQLKAKQNRKQVNAINAPTK